jgi:hypothetical protein
MSTLEVLTAFLGSVRGRLAIRDEAGYTTETIVVTALLVVLGLTVLGILAAKVIFKSNGISF